MIDNPQPQKFDPARKEKLDCSERRQLLVQAGYLFIQEVHVTQVTGQK